MGAWMLHSMGVIIGQTGKHFSSDVTGREGVFYRGPPELQRTGVRFSFLVLECAEENMTLATHSELTVRARQGTGLFI